jgi:hypothetical protein
MKAIKDCKLEVEVDDYTKYQADKPFYWSAYASKNKKENLLYFQCLTDFKTLAKAKKNWETFAKLNGIKNWKYV